MGEGFELRLINAESFVNRVILGLSLCLVACLASSDAPVRGQAHPKGNTSVRLGNFSVSLAVKNLSVSREFYEQLGFHVIAGDGKHFSILQNETATIGLFQGMFEKNILTFNPGWDRAGHTLADFDDIRDLQRTLAGRGVKIATKADESTTGPASITLVDPDGNPILIDQHVPSPQK
jgi:catechol 2,3-dioxygenase-like lactoylglutathione lyase family enzyme